MEKLTQEQLKHILPEERASLQQKYVDGEFGAHTYVVLQFLSSEKLPIKKMFSHVEQYLPSRDDLPNFGLSNILHIIAISIFATTAQRSLALDAEEYCRSSKENLTVNEHDIAQRLVWERSNELVEPFWE